MHKKPVEVHYLNDTNQTPISNVDAKIFNEQHAEKIKNQAVPVLYCNLGRLNSNKLNTLTENYPNVKIFGISEARLSKGYIDSGKLLPPGYVLVTSPVDNNGLVHSVFLVAREYEDDLKQIESRESVVTIRITSESKNYFLSCSYGFNKGSQLFITGFNNNVDNIDDQFSKLAN